MASSRTATVSNFVIATCAYNITIILFTILPTTALLCYTCSYLETDADNTCLTDANTTQITNCSKKYCTIVRQEAVRPAGKVISFIRDCVDKPLYLNAVKEDSTFKTYYRSCISDLCNDSDGTHSATNSDPNFGASENIIIKGKNSGSLNSKVNLLLVFGSALLMFFTKLN